MAEMISKTPARLAVNLLTVFFSREKIAAGNCTPAPNRELLDQRVIRGIKGQLMTIYCSQTQNACIDTYTHAC